MIPDIEKRLLRGGGAALVDDLFLDKNKGSREVSACPRARASLGLFGWSLPNTANVMESTKMEVRSLFFYSYETRTLTLKRHHTHRMWSCLGYHVQWEMSPITLYGWSWIRFFIRHPTSLSALTICQCTPHTFS